MHQHIVGIDNGATGSIAVITDRHNLTTFCPTACVLTMSPGKSGKKLSRLDRRWLRDLLTPLTADQVKVFIERPFTGQAMMVMQTIAAARFFEATICTLEDLEIGYEVVDSRTWQKATFGSQVTGSANLKLASLQKASQLWPKYADLFAKQGDGDSALIAHHFSRN
jgi:hypothetical protein